jgi:hypothetical protein
MGTRINVLLDHALTDSHSREALLARLATALPAALGVRDYWRSADPLGPRDELEVWRQDHVSPRAPYLLRYTGPGSLFLTVTTQAARIRTGGRWRGFLSIEPLRCVHLAVFRQIAASLGSRCLALYADCCEIDDLFWSGRTQWDCIELMERLWGPPQRSVEEFETRIANLAEQTVPSVWFLESSKDIAEPGAADVKVDVVKKAAEQATEYGGKHRTTH